MDEVVWSLKDVEPSIAVRLEKALTQKPGRNGGAEGNAGFGCALTLGAAYSAYLILNSDYPNTSIGTIAAAVIGIAGGGASICWGSRGVRKAMQHLYADDFRFAAELSWNTRAEGAYIQALGALAEARQLLGSTLMRDLLAQLNDLMRNARVLEEKRAVLASDPGLAKQSALEREYQVLVERLETAPDEASRQAVAQSIALCEGRLRPVRQQASNLLRVEAQEEVVYQTLASVEASLRRMIAAPPEMLDLPLGEIRRSTAEAIAQTGYVEQAIQEVGALTGL